MKVLNLYAGIGGNRRLWKDVEVTAVEIKKDIANVYKDIYPDDKVIVEDAHKYLLKHYKEFDFIWTSPPCPSHSHTNHFLNAQGIVRYPDMNLYQEIIFLKNFFKGNYVVENVIPYYEPLIIPQISGRHVFWCNFKITNLKKDNKVSITNAKIKTRRTSQAHIKELEDYHGINLEKYNITNKKLLLRNCVNPKLGLHIFNCAFKEKQIEIQNFE